MICLEIRSSKVQGKCALEIPTVASTEYLLESYLYWSVKTTYYTEIRRLDTTLGGSEGDDDEYNTNLALLIFFFS